MQLCSAPCASLISRKNYLRRIRTAKDFLNGNTEPLVKTLTAEMTRYSKALKFEKAAEIRDQIKQVQEIKPDQFMQENYSAENNDYVGIYQDGETAAVSVISVRNGIVNDKKTFLFTRLLPDTEFIADFFNLYYLNEIFLPSTIYFRDTFLDEELFYSAIEKKRGCKIKIEKPTIQKDRRLTKLAIDNAEIFYEEKKLKLEKIHHLRELKKILQLEKIPRKIECFDIATLNGKFNTAAMSVFVDGNPERSLYRQFNVEGEGHPDDYSMMKEIMARRYQRLQIEKQDFPDLILLDGGKGQLNAAAEIIDLLNIDVSMAAIAEKEEHIFIRNQKEPIVLPRSSYALKIIQHIRDEAHRFSNTRLAVRYKNDSLKTQLENIPGIGKTRARFLLKTFGSVEKIKTLSQEELASLPQIGNHLAKNLYQFFHQCNQE
jgi:excinuclease ABC subunit C